MTSEHIKTLEKFPNLGDDYTLGCLLDHLYFKESYKLIAIDLK